MSIEQLYFLNSFDQKPFNDNISKVNESKNYTTRDHKNNFKVNKKK